MRNWLRVLWARRHFGWFQKYSGEWASYAVRHNMKMRRVMVSQRASVALDDGLTYLMAGLRVRTDYGDFALQVLDWAADRPNLRIKAVPLSELEQGVA